MTQEWYRWNAPGAANAALGHINGRQEFPLAPGRPGKQGTVQWCLGVTACADGKHGFPRIPEETLDYASIPQPDRAAFLENFVENTGGTIEEFSPSWVSERDSDGNQI